MIIFLKNMKMRRCSVLNCKNNSGKPSSDSDRISFHSFPKDPDTRQAWIYATGRLNWTPRQHSTICSEHFTEYDFTVKNGKKYLRSTTVPRFNLNEQNSRYTESQYHNETQAALEFLTGQMFPETQVPAVEKESEVVTLQVIGGSNPNVVVKKSTASLQNKPTTPEQTEKKLKYFSVVNVFKSEAELKAEKDKIHELIRDNLDPSISKVLLSLEERPKKWKKKSDKPKNPTNDQRTINQPRQINGKWVKSTKNQDNSAGHYTETLTREELIHKLKQKDMQIRQLQLTIRELQKTHLRDQVQIESLRVKLKLSNNQTDEETTSEAFIQRPQNTHSNNTSEIPARQQIVTQKRQRIETPNTENHYQSNRNSSDQDQAYFDTQNRHSNVGFKRPVQQYIIKHKRQTIEASNTENNHQSNSNFSNQHQAYSDTQNRHSNVGFKRPAQQHIVTQKRQRIENTTNTENSHHSNRNFTDQDQPYFDTQNRHSNVGFKRPAQQQIVKQKRQRIVATDTENSHQTNRNFSDQDQTHLHTQNRQWDVGLKRPAQQQKIVIQRQPILVAPSKENRTNQSNMIFSDQDRTHFFDF